MPKNATIALVDDSDLIRETMTTILEEAGFIVHSFSCPTQLLQSELLNRVDCILTDLDMPVMNGCELQLRMMERQPKLPIVFMTGSSDDRPRRDAVRRGAFAYLSKPTRVAVVIGILAEAVAAYGMFRGIFPHGLSIV